MGLRRIRRAVGEDRYEFSLHALEEMDEDGLVEEDVRCAILRGRLDSELGDDPRGSRFVLRGQTLAKEAEIEVVCRFLPSGMLRIIIVHAIEEE